jgi:polysaccharide biosynthesis/export protein
MSLSLRLAVLTGPECNPQGRSPTEFVKQGIWRRPGPPKGEAERVCTRVAIVKTICILVAVLWFCTATLGAREPSPETATDQSTISAQSESEQSRAAAGPTLAQRYPRYLLRPTDVLEITFPISPEYNETASVQPDGYISLREVSDMYVEGKSIPEVTEELRKAYGVFLHEPIINIELRDFEKPYFVADGEIGKPGKYDMRGDVTLTEAIAIAGGFTDKAKHSDVVLYRRTEGGWVEAETFNVKKMLAEKDLNEDVHLKPGDLVYVPKNRLSKIRQFIPSTGLGASIY